MFLNSLNYFRAIAIVCIVFGHSLEIANFSFTSVLGDILFNLLLGGTSLFVFISGFLFHHIFYKKFIFERFITKKVKYVLVPYLILSTLSILYLVLRICIDNLLTSTAPSPFYNELVSLPILRLYLTGVPNFVGYWYIPFIMIVFAISPVFIQFLRLNIKTKIAFVLVLLVCSAFMHRGAEEHLFSVLQNVLFFMPVYLLGMLASEKKEFVYSRFKGKEFFLLFIVVALAFCQVSLGQLGNYHKDPFSFNGVDLMLIQKIVLCLFFMIFLHRYEHSKSKFLDIIAANSFGIFFLHGIIIQAFYELKLLLHYSFTSNSVLLYLLIASLVFCLSLAITLGIKHSMPKYSKFLIGS